MLFVLSLSLIKLWATRTVSSITDKLKTCTGLEVHNSFYDRASEQEVYKKIAINDPNVFERLTSVMTNAKYKLLLLPGAISTKDFVMVILYRDSTQIGCFQVIAGDMLCLCANRNNLVFESEDEALSFRIRDVLSLDGSSSQFISP